MIVTCSVDRHGGAGQRRRARGLQRGLRRGARAAVRASQVVHHVDELRRRRLCPAGSRGSCRTACRRRGPRSCSVPAAIVQASEEVVAGRRVRRDLAAVADREALDRGLLRCAERRESVGCRQRVAHVGVERLHGGGAELTPVSAAIVSFIFEKLRTPNAGSGTSAGGGGGEEAQPSPRARSACRAPRTRDGIVRVPPSAAGITAPRRDNSVPDASAVVSMRRNVCAATGTASLTAMRMFFTRVPVAGPTKVGFANT